MKLRGSNGCNGWSTTDLLPGRATAGEADAGVDGVEQLGDRDRRRPDPVGALVAAAVGDDQVPGGCEQGVEQQLAVLGAGVAVADLGRGEEQVVTVGFGVAGEGPVVETDQRDHPVRDRPHGHKGADGQVTGAEIGSGGTALEPMGEQVAYLGEGQLRSEVFRRRPVAGTGKGPGHFGDLGENPPELLVLPLVRRRADGQQLGAGHERVDPGVDGLEAGQTVERRRQALEQLGEPPDQVGLAGRNVVVGEGGAEHSPVALGHSDAEQQPVQSGRPGVGADVAEGPRLAMVGIQSPPDPGIGHPLFQRRQVVLVEMEAAGDRRPRRQVEHLGGGDPGPGKLQELGGHAEQRVGLADRAVGQPDPKARQAAARRVPAVLGVRVGRVVGAESGVDQRRESFDVGAHHDDVARFECFVGGEEVEHGVAHHLDLASPAVTGVDLQ